MEMLVYVAALRTNDIILQSQHNLHVVDVQVTRDDMIKVSANFGDPTSMPGTYFFDRSEQVIVLRTYFRTNGKPMRESNTYPHMVGEEWDEGRLRMRLVLKTDGESVWATPESVKIIKK